jgi:AcrR family transcriptional regulator
VSSDEPASVAVKARPGGRNARVRAAVLAATAQELTEFGYSGLSLERIAARAGVHKSTLYRRWRTREDLVLGVMLERAAEAVEVPDSGSLREDLLRLARTAVANMASPAVEAVVRASISELRSNPVIAEFSQRFWAERLRLDGQIIKRAIDRGEVPASTESRLVIESVLGPLHLQLLITGLSPSERVIKRTVDLVVSGVIREIEQP